MGYICQNCGHVSGYHIQIKEKDGISYGKCKILDCNCKCFEWDEDQWKRVNKKIKDYKEREKNENIK
jgi:hypothetical protein